MVLNSKLLKVVSYIQDNKYWERMYVILKLLSPCLWLLCIDDSKKLLLRKVYYYFKMTNISILKQSSNLENEELFPVSGSTSQKVWS